MIYFSFKKFLQKSKREKTEAYSQINFRSIKYFYERGKKEEDYRTESITI